MDVLQVYRVQELEYRYGGLPPAVQSKTGAGVDTWQDRRVRVKLSGWCLLRWLTRVEIWHNVRHDGMLYIS